MFNFFIHMNIGKYTPQYIWLKAELAKVDRTKTPWLIVLLHTPWYNTYDYHYLEGETMRVVFEPWFVKYKVDVVFAGHVHAYERSVSAKVQMRKLMLEPTLSDLEILFLTCISVNECIYFIIII